MKRPILIAGKLLVAFMGSSALWRSAVTLTRVSAPADLQSAADFKKRGRVTYKGLDVCVSDRVDELTKGEQTPVTPVLQGVADFTIAQVKR